MHGSPCTYFTVKPAPNYPIGSMILGKSRQEVAELLPRVFNLCRTSQSIAVNTALDLPVKNNIAELNKEILLNHVMRLCVIMPRHFGLPQIRLPKDWHSGNLNLRKALFGPLGNLPVSLDDFKNFLESGVGIAGLLNKVAVFFAPGEGISRALPFVSVKTATNPYSIVDNSCAQRVKRHPVVASMATNIGQYRSLFWRLVAISYDLEASLNNAPLKVIVSRRGCVHVPATRGLYTVSAQHDGEKVTHFTRVTPTDHLCVKGGVLEQVLATILPERASILPIIMDILDPCTPLCIEKITNA